MHVESMVQGFIEAKVRSGSWARWEERLRAWGWAVPLGIFLLALIPRLCGLNSFLTADEDDQVQFAAGFLTAVLAGDWARAALLGYPGVPSMAFGGLGLGLRYLLHTWGWAPLPGAGPDLASTLSHVADYPLVYIPAARAVMGVVAALAVAGMYGLMRRLVGRRIALLAAILIAFDPWFMAHTRILHVDAPLAYFMFLSFLAFWVYLKEGRWRWLVLSGICGALATLSKTPGVILGPILAATGLIYAVHPAGGTLVGGDLPAGRRGRRFGLALVMWGGVAALTFYALWPSMWINPGQALSWITENARIAMQTSHPSTGIFWGSSGTSAPALGNFLSDFVRDHIPSFLRGADHSSLYYIVSLPFRLSPLTSLGLLLGLVVTWRWRRYRPLLLTLWLYAIVFIIPVSLVGRRGDRYVLPVYLALDMLAAMALGWLGWRSSSPACLPDLPHPPAPSPPGRGGEKQGRGDEGSSALPPLNSVRRRRLSVSWRWVVGTALVLQLGGVLWLHPYYFDYLNPLVGGGLTAPYFINIGWGEGLDQAAAYLNQLPDAAHKTVAAWYSAQFAPFFSGQTVDMASNEPALSADYAVLYINQRQRGFPSKEMLQYFGDRQPVHSIWLDGVEYVQIFKGPVISFDPPGPVQYPVGATLGGALRLLGYATPQSALCADDELDIALYWQVLAPIRKDYNVTVRLVDDVGNVWGQVDRMPLGGLWRTHEWKPGAVIQDEYRLRLRPGTPPDMYQLEVSMYRFATGETFGVANDVGLIQVMPARRPPPAQTLTAQHALHKTVAPGLELIGYDLGADKIGPGQRLPITLYWYAARSLGADYAISFDARSVAGNEGGSWQEAMPSPHYPTSQWRAGEAMVGMYQLQMPADARSGFYVLNMRLLDTATGQALSREILGKLEFVERPRSFATPAVQYPLGVDLGGVVQLIGYDLPETTVMHGQPFKLTLYWRALAETKASYTVFIHVVGPDGVIRGQWDSVPGSGSLPTTGWLKGEVITDSYLVPMAQDAPPWRYTILVGMYDPDTGERLRETGGYGRDAIPAGAVQVK